MLLILCVPSKNNKDRFTAQHGSAWAAERLCSFFVVCFARVVRMTWLQDCASASRLGLRTLRAARRIKAKERSSEAAVPQLASLQCEHLFLDESWCERGCKFFCPFHLIRSQGRLKRRTVSATVFACNRAVATVPDLATVVAPQPHRQADECADTIGPRAGCRFVPTMHREHDLLRGALGAATVTATALPSIHCMAMAWQVGRLSDVLRQWLYFIR